MVVGCFVVALLGNQDIYTKGGDPSDVTSVVHSQVGDHLMLTIPMII